MKRLLSSLFFLFVFCTSALAQEAPDALVKRVTEDVLTIVRQDKDIQGGNTKKAIDLVEAKVSPNFNFTHMTAFAMGRDWNTATAEQKKRLTEEFKILLVRTYSNALTGYRDQTVRYLPSRIQAQDTDGVIKTEIVQAGSKPVPIDYSLEKRGNQWLVYDVVVAGVSLVINYRTTFNQEVQANGIDGLIKMLVNKNKQMEPLKK